MHFSIRFRSKKLKLKTMKITNTKKKFEWKFPDLWYIPCFHKYSLLFYFRISQLIWKLNNMKINQHY